MHGNRQDDRDPGHTPRRFFDFTQGFISPRPKNLTYAEVFRERVFLLACKRSSAAETLFQDCSPNQSDLFEMCWIFLRQDFRRLTADEVHTNCHKRWNHAGRIPIEQWLMSEASKTDVSRLEALGNVVMPPLARLGLHTLAAYHVKM